VEFTIYLSLIFLALYLAGLIWQRRVLARDRRLMRRQSRAVARADEIAPGQVKKFWLICEKYRIDGLLVNHQGQFHAYVNRCRHMPTPLDFIRDQFLSDDGCFLMCYTHGALYEFATGLCVDGPCKGESLYRLPVRVEGGEVVVGCPEGNLKAMAD
jgi:nitrite reductase/ring-hydroxylating ferredoxin subunit